MDALLGTWKLQNERNEGSTVDVIKAMGIPEQYVEPFAKSVYTLTIGKVGDDQYTYTFKMEGDPDEHKSGPCKLGETFEAFDDLTQRTEVITVTFDGGKMKEVTTIKENPDITWTTIRWLEGGELIATTEIKGFNAKAYHKKV